MATDMGRGIIAPDTTDKISVTGVAEMRTLAASAAVAVDAVKDYTEGEVQKDRRQLATHGAKLDKAVYLDSPVVPKMTPSDNTWAAIVAEDRAGQVAIGVRHDGTVFVAGQEGAGGSGNTATGYDIIVAAGQSDMSGAGKPYGPEIFPPHPRVFQYPAKRWPQSGQIIPATEPLLHQGPITSAAGAGPALVFAKEWAEAHPDRIVLIVPTACTSTGFTTTALNPAPEGYTASVGCWQLNRTGEPLNLGRGMIDQTLAAIAAARSRISAGQDVKVRAFVWSQGLSDGRLSTEQYAAYFDELVNGLKAAINQPDLPVVVGQMSPSSIKNTISAHKIDKAHLDTPRRFTRAGYAYSFGDLQMSPENNHLSARGQQLYGRALFEAYNRAVMNVPGLSPLGVENLTARRLNNGTVRVRWTAPASRVLSYTVEHSTNGTDFTTAGVTRYHEMDCAAEIAGANPSHVRVITHNETGPSVPVIVEL